VLIFLESILFIVIFSLVTLILIILPFLFIVSFTFVQAGHLIQLTISFSELLVSIFLSSTLITISHHFSHAFSDGDPGIGEVIFNIQGFSISTYDHIPSYSDANES